MKISPEHDDQEEVKALYATRKEVTVWLLDIIPNWQKCWMPTLPHTATRVARMLMNGDTIMARMNGETLEIRATKRKN